MLLKWLYQASGHVHGCYGYQASGHVHGCYGYQTSGHVHGCYGYQVYFCFYHFVY